MGATHVKDVPSHSMHSWQVVQEIDTSTFCTPLAASLAVPAMDVSDDKTAEAAGVVTAEAGATVSGLTVQVRLADPSLPAASELVTVKVCAPAARAV
jgi:hypothetical protein